jgi:hypothetical protein
MSASDLDCQLISAQDHIEMSAPDSELFTDKSSGPDRISASDLDCQLICDQDLVGGHEGRYSLLNVKTVTN